MIADVVAALSWEPQIKGGLYVLLALLILPGAAFLLLSTNVGARLGFQLAGAGLFGFMVIMGVVWWVYGIGPVGRPPVWKPDGIVTGDLARSRHEALERFPRGWERLEVTDPEVADAQPIVDGELVSEPGGGPGRFESSADFLLIGAFEKGGESYGPLGLNIRPFDVFHKPHYLMVQVQKSIRPEPVPGQPPPRAMPDPASPPVAVVMLRDLGSERLNPAVATISSTLIFGLFVYQLHVRDKEAAAKREGADAR